MDCRGHLRGRASALCAAGDAAIRRFVAWGALAWIISALLVLILPVPYTLATIAAALVLVAGLVSFALRRRFRPTSVPLLKGLVWPFGLFVVVVTIPSLLQVAEVHPDTYDMLLMASDLAGGELSPTTLNNFGLFGLGLPLLQSAVPWFGVAFFYSLPAAFTFTLFLVGVTWWGLIWWFVVAALLLLARAPQFQYQRALSGLITAFFALYVIFGLLHGYAAAIDGSGNRMALHILPVIFLYVTLRAAPYLAPAADEKSLCIAAGTDLV
jgi:hypothetical protein